MTNFRKGNHGFRSESKERDHHYYYICSAFWRPYQSKLHNGCILFWSSILTNEWLLTILYFLLLFRFHIFGSHKNLAQEEMQIHNQKRLRITKASHVYPSVKLSKNVPSNIISTHCEVHWKWCNFSLHLKTKSRARSNLDPVPYCLPIWATYLFAKKR